MPTTQALQVKKLVLDVKNFRTIEQPDEAAAIQALINVDPLWFWALMESLLDDGYLPTENIIVLQQGSRRVVKEGNRRVAALKIILGIAPDTDLDVPAHLVDKRAALTTAWKKNNAEVPCTVYEASEGAVVDKVIALTHGKSERAGRLSWSAVARARHNRNMLNASEPGLDLLEKFLEKSRSLTTDQAQYWAGNYPVTVLDEAIKKLAPRLSAKSAADLAKAYPRVANRTALDKVVMDIGDKHIGFKEVRATAFGTTYGLPPPSPPSTSSPAPPPGSPGSATPPGSPTSSPTSGGSTPGPASSPTPPKSPPAHPVGDPKAVSSAVRRLKLKGTGREKVAALLVELKRLDLEKTPHAFCFVLRSMFEISAKAYCNDHASASLTATKADGSDRTLISVLKDIVKHLTVNNTDNTKVRLLHGAITELDNSAGLLSVTSMNQLVHNPRFAVDANHVALVFANVLPLLEQMNK